MAELEAKINECNSKGAEDVLVSQKATKAAGRRKTTANTPKGEKYFYYLSVLVNEGLVRS